MDHTILFPLQGAYNDYCKGIIEKKKLESIIFAYIVENPQRFCLNRWNQDDFFDYLFWAYPRFGKSIERYKSKGATFDAYINSVVRLSFKEFCFRKKDQKALESSWWNAYSKDSYAAESEPEYDAFKPVNDKVKNQRQVLFLLLKCYYFLSDDFIERIAPVLNMEITELVTLINNLHELREHQEDEIRYLKNRINTQYYRCICFESRMKASAEGSSHYERMKKYLEKGRAKLHSMRKRLSRMRLNASNQELADLLGIPKGTIDSSLHALKGNNERKKRKSTYENL
jgi:DNA-directed RNA polymerase specialized sigma24 family protein